MKILIINAQPDSNNKESYSNATLEYLKSKLHDEVYTQVDLETLGAPALDQFRLEAFRKMMSGEELSTDETKMQEKSNEIVDQFLLFDVAIIVSPLYNLSITAQLKTYLDNLVVVGKTVKYSEEGPQGLITKPTAVRYIQSSGSVYSTNEEPYKSFNNAPKTVKSIFNFLGVKDISTIYVEGTAFLPKDQILNKMHDDIDKMLKEFNL